MQEIPYFMNKKNTVLEGSLNFWCETLSSSNCVKKNNYPQKKVMEEKNNKFSSVVVEKFIWFEFFSWKLAIG